jgi:hypothetical protein
LLFFATFLLRGRIGFWSDDYYHNLRDPATGALPPLTWSGLTIDRGFFLRPLFYKVVPPLTTLAWTSQWPAHLVMTVAHGLVVWLLWRLMRTLGLPKFAAAGGALAFMVYPAHFEALFWVSALPTTLASALMLWMMILYANYARQRGAFARWWAVVSLAALPALAFAVCCLNEQPAMGVLVLPLIFWAARTGSHDAMVAESRPVSWLRALLPAVLCGLAVLLYSWMVVSDPHKPPGARGSSDQFVTLAHLPARARHFFDVLWRRLVLLNFWRGAMGMGGQELRAAGWPGWLGAAGVVGAGVMWVREWTGRSLEAAARGDAPRRGPLIPAILAGLALFATAWAPIVMIAIYDPDSRTRYWPATGLAIASAAAASAIGRRHMRPWAAVVPKGVFLVALLACSTMLIGVQSAFRARWDLDRQQGRQLRQFLPDPTPLTFFVPMDIQTTGIRTGSPLFDSHFRSVWEFPWTVPKFIETVYGRDDVRCGHWKKGTPSDCVKGADESGIHFTVRLGPRFPRIEGSGSRVAWDRAAPFVIDREGRVHLVTRIVIPGRGAGGAGDVAIPIPQFRRAVEAGRISELEVKLPRA